MGGINIHFLIGRSHLPEPFWQKKTLFGGTLLANNSLFAGTTVKWHSFKRFAPPHHHKGQCSHQGERKSYLFLWFDVIGI